MAGTDLTNQIVGTLIRFRQERIAFVAAIEKMFCHVLGFVERSSVSRDACTCVW